MTRQETLEYARQWDPQWFHVDEDAASQSVHRGIIASGLHTRCVAKRLCINDYLGDVANLGARSISEIRFEQPVWPGDGFIVYGEVLNKETGPHQRPLLFRLRTIGRGRERTHLHNGVRSSREPPRGVSLWMSLLAGRSLPGEALFDDNGGFCGNIHISDNRTRVTGVDDEYPPSLPYTPSIVRTAIRP